MYKMMTLAYGLSALAYGAGMLVAWKFSAKIGASLRLVGTAFLAAGLGLGVAMMTNSWITTGEPPFQTLYQSLVFFSVTTALVHLAATRRIPIVGLASAAFILAILAYAFIKQDAELAQRMPPALQSAWFVPHVVVYFLGYAALFLAFITSILALIFPDPRKLAPGNPLGVAMRDFNMFSYKAIMFGFVMISAGLLLGAFWAKFAWGDWWTWDPKENWSLITWLTYAAYLHLRFVKGISPRTMAWVSIIGFLAVMFTYLGVNYLPEADQALHSYQ